MKIIFSVLCICMSSFFLQAQDSTNVKINNQNNNENQTEIEEDYIPYKGGIRTLSGSKKSHHGAYVGILARYSRINNEDAILVGGKIGYLMNHSFGFGVGGYGLISEYQGDYLTGGYGGLIFEPILFPKFPVHASFPILIGGGAVSTFNDTFEPFESIEESDVFAIVEPGVNIELNVSRFFRIGLGASYRFTSDINEDIFEDKLIEGWSTGISLTFGRF